VCFAVIGGVVLAVALQTTGCAPAAKVPEELTVFVRPGGEANQPLPIDSKGALPVKAGGSMTLEVHLAQPATIYLVWLDSEGQLVPLYPWNPERLDVTDINAPPPQRRATNVLFSPVQLGGGWKLGDKSGMETVFLLTRKTPLPEGTKMGALFDPLPPPARVREPEELVVAGVDKRTKAVATRVTKSQGDMPDETPLDEELTKLLLRLSEHFDLVRAVRFAHVVEESSETKDAAKP
jgi:hypothetical protein